jgi:hypothetical protein
MTLLLEGTTGDVHGRGLDWFHVLHRANTVFDVDAWVPASAPVPEERIVELRKLVRDLESALAELEAGNT